MTGSAPSSGRGGGRLQPVRSTSQPPAALASTFLPGEAGETGDTVATLRWGLRRFAWLVLLCVVAVGVLLPLQQLNKVPTFTSESLVVAVDLQADVKTLPRYGVAIFDNGQVAARVIEEFGDAGDPEDVVPQRVSIVTEQDSIILRVQGHGRDAQTAADIANLAATVVTSELNKAGSGVGAFAVQSVALPPVESDEPLRAAPYSVAAGLVAGLVTGFGLLLLLLVLRRPIVDAAAASRATDLPVFGTVTLPRVSPSGTVPVDQVRGLAPLCRQLLDWSPGVVVVIGPAGASTERHHLADALAEALEQVRHVSFATAPTRVMAAEDGDGEVPGEGGATDRVISVIDGLDPIDLVEPGPRSFIVLVVPIGTGVVALRRLAGELRGVPTAIVLVRTRRRRRRRSSRSGGRRTGRSPEPDRAPDAATEPTEPDAATEPTEPDAATEPTEPTPHRERPVANEDVPALPADLGQPPGPDVHRSPSPASPATQSVDVLSWVAAEVAEWIPATAGSGASLRVVRWHRRLRCRIYELEVRGPDTVTGLIVKVRSLDPTVRRRDLGQGRPPALSPSLHDDDDLAAARAEFVGLRCIDESLRKRPRRGLRAVEPFGLNTELAAVAMERVAAPTLREHALSTVWGSAVGLPYRPALPWSNTGAWLKRYHAAVPAGSLPELRGTKGEVVELLQAFGAFLGPRVRQGGLLTQYVESASRAAELFLGEDLPTVAVHGDYVAQNVFVTQDGGVAAIDPFPRWRAPAFEDLGRLVVAARLFEPDRAHPDYFAARAAPRLNETALLTGYFGAGAVPVGPMRVFLALCTLDRWADAVSKEPTNLVRRQLRASRIAAASQHYRREMSSQLAVMLPESDRWTDGWI